MMPPKIVASQHKDAREVGARERTEEGEMKLRLMCTKSFMSFERILFGFRKQF